MNKILVSFSLLISMYSVRAMQDDKLTVYAIPGQNGGGSSKQYVSRLLGEDNVNVVEVSTPSTFPDLGQEFCIRHLRKAIAENPSENAIIHATSQGTATAINYVAHEDKGRRIKGLILEAALASGNSAIQHTVGGQLVNLGTVTRLPGSYYWLPYIAQIAVMPAYFPAGKQPIKSISKIPDNLPVIIAHSKDDIQLPYNGACALYAGLKLQGNENAYLMTKAGRQHIHILDNDYLQNVVQNILKKHTLLPGSANSLYAKDFDTFQPNPERHEACYDYLYAREKAHEWIAGSACATLAATLGYYAMSDEE